MGVTHYSLAEALQRKVEAGTALRQDGATAHAVEVRHDNLSSCLEAKAKATARRDGTGGFDVFPHEESR